MTLFDLGSDILAILLGVGLFLAVREWVRAIRSS